MLSAARLRSKWSWLARSLAATALALVAVNASAQTGENVLLVVNSASAASDQIGQHYARARAVPQDNILRLTVDANEEISRPLFERQIESPIIKWLNRTSVARSDSVHRADQGDSASHCGHDGQNRYRVECRLGADAALSKTPGLAQVSKGTNGIDLLMPRILDVAMPLPQGPIANPYFMGDRPIAEAKPFTHEAFDIFLVARLDGFSVADVLALIDRGRSPVRSGRIALDEKLSLTSVPGNRWLERSAELLKNQGFGERVLLDATSKVIANETDLLGYFSWGSNDPATQESGPEVGVCPGRPGGDVRQL